MNPQNTKVGHRRFGGRIRRFAKLRTVPCQRPRWDSNPRLHRDRVASIPDCSARTYLGQIAQVRLEPKASLVLSQGGLPIAYRAVSASMPKAGVEPAIARPSSHEHRAEPLSRLAYLGVLSSVIPDGLEPSSPGCEPGIFAAGIRDQIESGLIGNRTRIFGLQDRCLPVGP